MMCSQKVGWALGPVWTGAENLTPTGMMMMMMMMIIIIIFINYNWVVTRWQWLFYMYTKYEIGY